MNKAYIEGLDNYIGSKVFLPGKDFILVLSWGKCRKRDALGNSIGEEHINPILDTGYMNWNYHTEELTNMKLTL